jgi:hypothetical protein
MNDLIAVEKIAQWQKLKTLVLDSVSSPITKRVYNMAAGSPLRITTSSGRVRRRSSRRCHRTWRRPL